MREIQNAGLYIIKDSFFEDYPSSSYMENKHERRPHYYAIKDRSGLLWMVPLSTQVDKYRRLIQQSEERHGNCVYYHLAPIYGKTRAFIICDMFPVTEDYILRPYVIGSTPYVVQNSEVRRIIREKAFSYLNMVEHGVLHSPLNVLETRRQLLEK